MEILKTLYNHWSETVREPMETRKSWLQIDEKIAEILPESNREEFTQLLEEHCHMTEYGAFCGGFRVAFNLLKELNRGE